MTSQLQLPGVDAVPERELRRAWREASRLSARMSFREALEDDLVRRTLEMQVRNRRKPKRRRTCR